MFRRKWLLAVIAVASVACTADSAQAAFRFSISGDVSASAEDWYFDAANNEYNAGSLDKDDAENSISFLKDFGLLTIQSITGSSNPPGDPYAYILSTNTKIENKTGSTKTITLVFEQDNFTSPAGVGEEVFLRGQVDSFVFNTGIKTNGGAVSGKYKTQVVDGSDVHETNELTFSQAQDDDQFTNEVYFERKQSSYTLRTIVELTLADNSNVTFNTLSIVAVPAPPALVLAATAVPFFGLLRRRMRKTEVAA